MNKEDTPTIQAFVMENHIDLIRRHFKEPNHDFGTQPEPGNTEFRLGEDVVLWLNNSGVIMGLEGVVVNVSIQLGANYDRAVYDVAVPAKHAGVFMVVQNLYGHIGKAGETTPKHNYRAWPDEIINDRRQPQRPKLTRVK